MNTIAARDLQVGTEIAVSRKGVTGYTTVTEVVAVTAKTITVRVAYDDVASALGGGQRSRTNRYGLGTILPTA
ncbi:hypothetical protein SEA_MARIOKART_66 [Gordonia phage Mariokart]|nr:hypothetical protein SEA_MARIOKART_66 [Gordonia phage Mariokart]